MSNAASATLSLVPRLTLLLEAKPGSPGAQRPIAWGRATSASTGRTVFARRRHTPAPHSNGARPTMPRLSADAERRQITVMFFDLVGSTALSSRLDPEDIREVIARLSARGRGRDRPLRRLVAKFMGDGVLAYFGWPHAHEDEAERAVRAGLGWSRRSAASMSIGGAPGAGRDRHRACRRGRSDRRRRGARARCRRRDAEPGGPPAGARELRRGGDRRRHAPPDGGCSILADLGGTSSKASPRRGACASSASGASESRFEARHGARPSPLVGRDEELAYCCDAGTRRRRAGPRSLFSGDAGIGKSRLVRASDSGSRPAASRLRYLCSPTISDSTLDPLSRSSSGGRATRRRRARAQLRSSAISGRRGPSADSTCRSRRPARLAGG